MIYVDADACPVKAEILKVAERHGFEVTFVANSGLRPSRDPMVHNVIVSAGFDAADNWIAEHAGEGDVVVTADVPLAGRCVAAGCTRHRAHRPGLRQGEYRARFGDARPRGALAGDGRKQGLQRLLYRARPLRLSRNA
ncbi:hypothetical protein ABIA24_002445 [Sinorhizobium fredii]